MTVDTTSRRYRVLETLGEGGFGKVYRAEMQTTGGFVQQVALKIVSAKTAHAEEAVRRLRDEARILGYLRHRAVVRTLGLTRLDPGWAIVLEFIDGADCATLLRHLEIPLRVVAEIVEDVASALVAAWTTPGSGGQPLRAIHRDIKPANIRITSDGQVRVLDFGAARAEFDAREASTRSHILGSYKYMAPERFQGRDGPPVDIYSLGLVMAQLLVGEDVPEQVFGELEHRQMVTRLVEAVRWRLSREELEYPDVGESVVELMTQMLAFRPNDRPDASEVERRVRDLRGWLPGPMLREWAAEGLRGLPPQEEPRGGDEWSGSILIELGVDGADIQPQPQAAGARRGTTVRPGAVWLLPIATSAAVILIAGGLGVGALSVKLLGGGAADGPAALQVAPAVAPPTEPQVVPPTEPAAPAPSVTAAVTPSSPDVARATPKAQHPSGREPPAAVVEPTIPAAPPPPQQAPALPELVRVTASGDATSVVLQSNGERIALPAAVQPARYRVSAVFADGETWSGELNFGGEIASVECSSAFGKCKVK